MHCCTCSECGRYVTVRRIPVYAECDACRQGRDSHGDPPSGCLAGTALKALLATIGITADNNCSCNARAREMDARGCDWCEENIDTIVGWLRDEATKRGLPFLDAAGRMLVRRAIRNARRAAAS